MDNVRTETESYDGIVFIPDILIKKDWSAFLIDGLEMFNKKSLYSPISKAPKYLFSCFKIKVGYSVCIYPFWA